MRRRDIISSLSITKSNFNTISTQSQSLKRQKTQSTRRFAHEFVQLFHSNHQSELSGMQFHLNFYVNVKKSDLDLDHEIEDEIFV